LLLVQGLLHNDTHLLKGSQHLCHIWWAAVLEVGVVARLTRLQAPQGRVIGTRSLSLRVKQLPAKMDRSKSF